MAALVLLVAGCSSSGDDVAPTTVASTSSSSTTSTTEPSTTEAATTRTEAEPEWTPEELEVIAAYEAYQAAWGLAVEDWDAGIEAIKATSADDYGDGVVDYFEEAQAQSSRLEGDRSYEVRTVEFVTGDRAIITECGLGSFELIAADGEVLSPADEERTEYLVYGERLEGRWLIVGLVVSGSC